MDTTSASIGLEVEQARPDPAPGQTGYRVPAPPLMSRLFRWGVIVGEFSAVQVAVQATAAIAGFIIVRSLTKQEYALYAVANSGLAMFSVLAGTGLGPALRSIGGEVHDDRTRFSQLVTTVLQLRRYFALFALGISLPVSIWMLRSNGATATQTILLSVVLSLACWPLLATTVLRDAALMLGRYRKVQLVDFFTSAARLTCIVAAFAWLNAVLGLAFAAVANWFAWAIYRRRAAEDVDNSAAPNEVYRDRALGITKQVLPNTLFFCFQGQVTFVLLTLFSTSTGLADVAALGRIAALLAIFGTVFNNVLAPRFARCQNPERLPQLYLGLIGLSIAFLSPIMVIAWFFPNALLEILGPAYFGLEAECFLVVTAACLSQLAGVMIWLNYSRNWIRWHAYLHIPAILGTQAACVLVLDLSVVRNVLLLSIFSALAPIPVYLGDTLYALRRARDQLQGENHPS